MLDTAVISGEDVCCNVVMTSVISFPLLSSVYECQRMECTFISPLRTECDMFVMYGM